MNKVEIIQPAQPSPLTPDELELIETGRYFEPRQEQIKELVHALDRDDMWSDDPVMFLKYALPAWLGGEHGASADKDQFTAAQRAAAWPIINEMGMLRRVIAPEQGMVLDDVVVVGGTTPANYVRQREVHRAIDESGLTVPGMKLWMGQRTRQPRDGSLEQLLNPDGPFPGNDISRNPWVMRTLEENGWANPDLWHAAFGTETTLGRATMLKLLSGGELLMPHRIDYADTRGLQPLVYYDKGVRKEVPVRDVLDYHFRSDAGLDVVLMNAAAEPRELGIPRHTTARCTREWLDRYPPADGAVVGYATTNPHTTRTAMVTRQMLRDADRDDISLVPLGGEMIGASTIYVDLGEDERGYRHPDLPSEPTIHTALGEVAAHISMDLKRNY
jgi:hypothetical protein